jgi:DMSO/TMAO reductase YedYZ molybdopterin-dependent catalytic subunit
MHDEPLNADHGAPFRLIVPHRYGVASVETLKRIDAIPQDLRGEIRGPPLNVRVARPAGRAGDGHARARADRGPGTRVVIAAGTYTVRDKAWSSTGPVTRVESSLTGAGDVQYVDVR